MALVRMDRAHTRQKPGTIDGLETGTRGGYGRDIMISVEGGPVRLVDTWQQPPRCACRTLLRPRRPRHARQHCGRTPHRRRSPQRLRIVPRAVGAATRLDGLRKQTRAPAAPSCHSAARTVARASRRACRRAVLRSTRVRQGRCGTVLARGMRQWTWARGRRAAW